MQAGLQGVDFTIGRLCIDRVVNPISSFDRKGVRDQHLQIGECFGDLAIGRAEPLGSNGMHFHAILIRLNLLCSRHTKVGSNDLVGEASSSPELPTPTEGVVSKGRMVFLALVRCAGCPGVLRPG